MTTSKDRLIEFLSFLELGQNAFEKKVGIANGYISKLKSSIGSGHIGKISTAYPELNTTWLLTGEGEMLKDAKPTEAESSTTGNLIPLFDAEAAAGSAYGVSMDAARQVGLIEIGSMLRDSEAAIRVYGNSMIPNYPPGCVIGVRQHMDSFIIPGKVYVIETRNDRYLKRLFHTQDKTALRCLSDNTIKFDDGPMAGEFCFPDFEIPLDEITRVFKVVGVIKRNNI